MYTKEMGFFFFLPIRLDLANGGKVSQTKQYIIEYIQCMNGGEMKKKSSTVCGRENPLQKMED